MRTVLLAFTLFYSPGLFAHTPVAGVGYFYNGILHPLFVPSHVILLLASGLLLGQQGVKQIGEALLLFLFSAMAGCFASAIVSDGVLEEFILLLSAIFGLIVAVDRVLPRYGRFIVGSLCGFLLALDSGQESLAGSERALTLLGTWFGLFLFLAFPIMLAEHCNRATWSRVLIRILGSWLTAVAGLAWALSLRTAVS